MTAIHHYPSFLRLAAAIIGCIAIPSLISCSHSENHPVVQSPVRVTVQPVTLSYASESRRNYSGTVEPDEKSTVSFVVSGKITSMNVGEGDRVGKGTVLASIDASDYENSMAITAAELHQAEDAYARLKRLHDAGALPEIKWVEVESKLKQARNADAIARRAVADATLHSPVAGVVSRKMANTGQTVLAAEPIFEIISSDRLKVNVPVPENQIDGIAEAMAATITFSELGGLTVGGRVKSKAVDADPLTRTYNVKIEIDSDDPRILPGMVASVTLSGTDEPEVSPGVVLPSQAVLLGADNRTFVWIADSGRAMRRFVTVQRLAEGGVMVDSGLVDGDSVIVAGMQKVGTGTPVITAVTDTHLK